MGEREPIPDVDSNNSEARAIFRAAEKLHTPHLVELPDGRKVLVTAVGSDVHSVKEWIDEYRDCPERRTGTARLDTVEAFIAHVKRFSDEHSVLFATGTARAAKLQAVLDYHEGGSAGKPRFGRHRALYEFPFSEEWKAWTNMATKPLTQEVFAEFIEARITDIADPKTVKPESKAARFSEQLNTQFADAAKMLTVARSLEVFVNHRVENKVNTTTGERVIHFEAEHQSKDGGTVKAPAAFVLSIPVFHLGENYMVPVRLRYRVKEGVISWFLELYRIDQTFDDAFDRACDKARDSTGLLLLLGSPES